MKKLFKFIYGSEPFELEFDVPLEKAISNLKSKVSKTSFSHLTSQGIVGTVQQDCTKLQRVIPMVQNSFKPIFVGSFHHEGDKTILKGILRYHRFVQVFMTIWFSFIAFWTVTATTNTITKENSDWSFMLHGLLMFGFGVGLVMLGKWFSRNDKKWLEERINNAITKNT